jgi:nucleotide-binding universal stress UspA family protein
MKKILVGLDGSEHERVVLAAAEDLARRMGATLLLYRAVPLPIGLPPNAFGITPAAFGDLLIDDAKQHLQVLAAADDLVAGRLVELGSPWRAICEAAKREKVDLIVIGSHGYHGLDRVLGTTAAKVVNHADRTVMVVREPLE